MGDTSVCTNIGDTFAGIYPLEKVFGVGKSGRDCSYSQERERVVRVDVWSVCDQSQDWLQVAAALSPRRTQSFGGYVRRPHHRGKMHHIAWRMRLRALRQEHPRWGAKSCDGCCKAFPQARRLPAVSTLARWLVELHLVKKRQRRARRGPVLPWRGVPAPKGCNQVWTIDFKGWFRTGDGQRCEPLMYEDMFSRYVLAVALLPTKAMPPCAG